MPMEVPCPEDTAKIVSEKHEARSRRGRPPPLPVACHNPSANAGENGMKKRGAVAAAVSIAVAMVLIWSSAAAEQLPLKTYTTADGLASDLVQCILSDSHGYLWFGTADGISRFDGYGFTNLSVADGLPGANVHAIIEARDGTYWAATNAGVFHWDPARSRIGSHDPSNSVHVDAGGRGDDVRALLEDPAGGMWVGTLTGLYRLDRAGSGWKVRRSSSSDPRRSPSLRGKNPPRSVRRMPSEPDYQQRLGVRHQRRHRGPDAGGRLALRPPRRGVRHLRHRVSERGVLVSCERGWWRRLVVRHQPRHRGLDAGGLLRRRDEPCLRHRVRERVLRLCGE